METESDESGVLGGAGGGDNADGVVEAKHETLRVPPRGRGGGGVTRSGQGEGRRGGDASARRQTDDGGRTMNWLNLQLAQPRPQNPSPHVSLTMEKKAETKRCPNPRGGQWRSNR